MRIAEDHVLLDQRTMAPSAVAELVIARAAGTARDGLEALPGLRSVRLTTPSLGTAAELGEALRSLRGQLVALAAAEGCFCAAYGVGLRLRVGDRDVPARPALADVLALLDDPQAAEATAPDVPAAQVLRWAIELTKAGVSVPAVVRRAAAPTADDERLLRDVPPHH